MSQLQVTGEAKIRDIQGPVVANSGVVTALDGAASQYVRGDGTLADFPTSSGGGSSVSYYLNSSVSQGTIGGVAYRELSKEPIIGAGTDIAISSNGYVANYLTDANDPDVILVPGGNFNCEFYFSVNNETGNPNFYAELYKYDGTTFTLLGTSVGVPEFITQGTTIAPYYFAIPVATAALALTDRLAIRIYVNVDGRTVTLHTENGHLCQVVTTFSKGMISLNNLTDQSQYLATGTSGTDFAIVSSGDTHTFNLPTASATNTGKLSSTDWSTFNGKVPYTGATTNVDLGTNDLTARFIYLNGTSTTGGNLFLRQDIGPAYLLGYTSIYATDENIGFGSSDGTNLKKAIFSFSSLTDNVLRTYTLPDASGTLALTSQLTGGTVTSVGLSSATSGITIGSSPITTSGTITLAIATASGSLNGLLSSTDWTTFNSKQATITLTTTGTSGAATFTSNTLNIPDYGSALSGYLPLSGGTLTGGLNGTTATFSGLGTFYQLTMTGATAGRIFYAQTGGVVSQSGNLNWNETNGMLGVGTPNPSAVITAFSTNAATQFKAAGTAPAITFSNTLTSASLACVFGLATANNQFITGTTAGDMAIANQSTSAGAIIFGTGTFEKMRMTSAGTFSIGNTNSTYNLDVTGTGRFTSTLLLGGALSGTSATFEGLLTINVPTDNTTVGIFHAGGGTANRGLKISTFVSVNDNAGVRLDAQTTVGGATLALATAGVDRLTIASTGAATFSSSVKASIYEFTGAVPATVGSSGYIDYSGGGSRIFSVGTSGATKGTFTFIAKGADDSSITPLSITNIGNIKMSQQVFDNNTAGTTRTLFIGNSDFLIGGVSSIRASKKNIKEFDSKWIYDLKPVEFNYRKKDEHGSYTEEIYSELNYGLIAEDTALIADFLINYNEDKDGSKKMIGIEYIRLITPMLKAIQELKAEIDELKNK